MSPLNTSDVMHLTAYFTTYKIRILVCQLNGIGDWYPYAIFIRPTDPYRVWALKKNCTGDHPFSRHKITSASLSPSCRCSSRCNNHFPVRPPSPRVNLMQDFPIHCKTDILFALQCSTYRTGTSTDAASRLQYSLSWTRLIVDVSCLQLLLNMYD